MASAESLVESLLLLSFLLTMAPEKTEKSVKIALESIPELHSATESIGRRNVAHRRVQSTAVLFSMGLEGQITHRPRSLSLSQPPSMTKYYPGSHLVGDYLQDGAIYLSLWLLPPASVRKRLSKEIAELSLKYTKLGSSAPFMPHVTIIGSIRCETLREAKDLGKKLRQGLEHTGTVPCRFHKRPCVAMHNENNELVWSQSCISIMERSDEYMNLLATSRSVLGLPPGEWMFPPPACEPHFSRFYGTKGIEDASIPAPENFVADEATLFLTTPGTVEGVGQWREVTRIDLAPFS